MSFKPFQILFNLLAWLCLALPMYAQIDTTSNRSSEDISGSLEDLVVGLGIDQQVDFSYITDLLEDLQQNPLDINEVEPEDLKFLPGMNEILATNLCNHRITYGNYTSIYELQAVKGFRSDLIRSILPYLTCKAIGEKDISPGAKHPAGPGLKELFNNLKGEVLQRSVFLLEDQRGYTELNDEGQLPYAGNNQRIYSRIRIRSGKNFSFALTGEKDPGEAFRWDPANRYYGYDFLSGHIAIKGYGILKDLVMGDYTLQFGQGLVLSRGLGFGKSANSIKSLKMPALGIRPYSSVNENQFMRGGAATLAAGDFYFTGFYSNNFIDASQVEPDTVFSGDFFEPSFSFAESNLQTSGLHRTQSELRNRASTREEIFGGRVAYQIPGFNAGFTMYQQQFDRVLNRGLNDYNQFDFRGDRNYLAGLDFDWVINNFNIFGELARSRSGGFGGVMGLMGSLAPIVDIGVQFRHFDKDFHSPKGYVFAERPTALQNETGVYLGLQVFPNPKWVISGYFDQYYFPFNKFRAGFPSRGHEQLLRITYKPRRGSEVYLHFRADNKEENGVADDPSQKLQFLVPTQRLQARLHFSTNIDRDFQLRSRIELSQFRKEGEEVKNGILMYQDIIWKLNYKLKLTGRYAIFDTPDYDARIYAYENDILGFFSIPPYYRTGSRYYFIINWKANRKLEFWGRIAQSRFKDLETIGSGNNQIIGDTQSEIKLQVRLKF